MDAREFNVQHTSESEWEEIIDLFNRAMQLDGQNGYKVWNYIDEDGLRNDIRSKKQYKIVQHGIINYYKSFGFEFIGNHTTGNEGELPISPFALQLRVSDRRAIPL